MAKDSKAGSKIGATKPGGPKSVKHTGTAAYTKKDSSGSHATKEQKDTTIPKAVSASKSVGKVTHLRPDLESRTLDPVPGEPEETHYRPLIEAALAENAARLEQIEKLQEHNRAAGAAQQANLERMQALLEEIKTAA